MKVDPYCRNWHAL